MGNAMSFESPIPEAEAAKWLGIEKTTLQKLRRAGEITFRKFGGRYFYTKADLMEYLEQQKVPACAEKIAPSTLARNPFEPQRKQ